MQKLKIFLYSIGILIIVLSLLFFVLAISKIKNSKDKSNKIQYTFLDKISLKPNYYPIWISKQEESLLIDKLKNAKYYLEFGSGGSTFVSLLYSNANVVSVESDIEWLHYIRKWRYIRNNEGKRLTLYHANIGKVAGSGYPSDDKNKNLFPNYSEKVFKNFQLDYDVVLIDGRFRVACTLQTILNTKDDIIILFHDFPERSYYHEVLKFLDINQNVERMVVLKKKNKINKKEVEQMFEKYKYDAR